MNTRPNDFFCTCFGRTGLHGSTHYQHGTSCCDRCGCPIQPGSVDIAEREQRMSALESSVVLDLWLAFAGCIVLIGVVALMVISLV